MGTPPRGESSPGWSLQGPLHPGPAPRLPWPRLDCRSTSSSLWHLSDALFTPAQPPEGWQACSSHDLDVLCVPGGSSHSDLPPPPLFALTKFAAAEARPIWAAGAAVCSCSVGAGFAKLRSTFAVFAAVKRDFSFSSFLAWPRGSAMLSPTSARGSPSSVCA